MKKPLILLILTLLLCSMLTGCMQSGVGENTAEDMQNAQASGVKPKIPNKLKQVEGVPQLIVYDVDNEKLEDMSIESYIAGVLAGEMRNDWPMEALKAQAILARTYALKFVTDKQSAYDGADISTDIREAQAYNEEKINDRILDAVKQTHGMVLSHEDALPITWFHAHAGGMTESARTGLDYEQAEPAYILSVASPDSEKAPTTVQHWTAKFTAEEVGQAAAQTGVKTGTAKTVEIGETSPTGRAVTLKINGQTVSGPKFRVALDSTKLKSMMIHDITVTGNTITFEGTGYGHGVGMSQWGAYAMAEHGKNAQQIIAHYFKDLAVVSLWD